MKKVVIITGASRGFGELIAKKFQKEKGWLAKRLSSESNVDQVMSVIEERSIWQRYGF